MVSHGGQAGQIEGQNGLKRAYIPINHGLNVFFREQHSCEVGKMHKRQPSPNQQHLSCFGGIGGHLYRGL